MPHSYTFRYILNNEVNGLENLEKKIIVDNWVSDSFDHLVLKLLSYFMFYNPEIKIDIETDYHFRPDLIVEGSHHQPRLWVECGAVDLKKLDKVATKCHNCDIYVVKKDKKSLENYFKLAKKKVRRIERIMFVGFEKGYVDNLADIILKSQKRTIDLYCDVTQDYITTTCNKDDKIESQIFKLKV